MHDPRWKPLEDYAAPNFKPVAGLEHRRPKLAWSVRLRCWSMLIGGLALIAFGIYGVTHFRGRNGAINSMIIVGVGLILFALSSPSQAERNGYRD